MFHERFPVISRLILVRLSLFIKKFPSLLFAHDLREVYYSDSLTWTVHLTSAISGRKGSLDRPVFNKGWVIHIECWVFLWYVHIYYQDRIFQFTGAFYRSFISSQYWKFNKHRKFWIPEWEEMFPAWEREHLNVRGWNYVIFLQSPSSLIH